MAASVSSTSPSKCNHFQLAFGLHDNHVGHIRDSSNDPGTSSDLDSSDRDYKTPELTPLEDAEILANGGSFSDAETVPNPSVIEESDSVAASPACLISNTHCKPSTSRSPEGNQSDLGSGCASTPQAELSQAKSIWEAADVFQNEVLSEQEKQHTEYCRIKWGSIISKALFCTACSEQFKTLNKNNVFVHPVLRVLLCYRCRTFYGEGVLTKDEEGLDEYCRWCANGGKLLCCDFCSNAFCKACLRRNLSRSYVKAAERASSRWKCCVCDFKPLWDHRAECRLVIEHLTHLHKKSWQKVKGTPSIQSIASSVSSEPVVATSTPTKADLENFMSKVKEAFDAFETSSLKLVGKRNSARVSRQYCESVSQLIKRVKEVECIVLRRGQGRFVRRSDLTDTEKTVISKIPAQLVEEQTDPVTMDKPEIGRSTETEIQETGRRETPVPKVVENEETADSVSSKAASSTKSQSILPPNCISFCPSPRANNETTLAEPLDVDSNDAETIVEDSDPHHDASSQEIPLATDVNHRLDAQQMRQTSPALLKIEPETPIEHPASSPLPTLTPILSEKDKTEIAFNEASNKSKAPLKQRKNPLESPKEDEDDAPAKVKKALSENEKARKAIQASTSSEEDNTTAYEQHTTRPLSSPDLFASECEDSKITVKKKAPVASQLELCIERKLKVPCAVNLTRLPDAIMKKLQITGFLVASALLVDSNVSEETSRKVSKSKDKLCKIIGRLIDVKDLLAKRDENNSDVESSSLLRPTKKCKKASLVPDSIEDSTSEDSDKSEEESEEGTNGVAEQASLISANEIARRQLWDSSEEGDESGSTEDQDGADPEDKNSDDEGDNDQQTPDETNGEENGDNNGEEEADNNEEANRASSSPANGETYADSRKKKSYVPNLHLTDSDTSDDDESRKRRREKEKKEPEEAKEEDNSNEEEEEEPKKKSKKKKEPEEAKEEDNSNEEEEEEPKKKKESEEAKEEDNSNEEEEEEPKKKSKKRFKIDSDSDFEPSNAKKTTDSKKRKASSSDSEEEQSDENRTKKRRRRIKQVSEDDDGEDSDVQVLQENQSSVKGGRKNIKKIMKDTKLTFQTKAAAKEEEERRKRISNRQKMYNVSFSGPDALTDARTDKIVLDFDPETKEELVAVHPDLVKKLKPHQVEGVKFMWEACFESLERMKTHPGSGCILAHCMGLGKTLQVVTLTHTVMSNEACGIKRVLIICPLVTVLNWVNEFNHWLRDELELDVYELASAKQNFMRQDKVNAWYRRGGILVMGYEMYRNLTNEKAKRIKPKVRAQFQQALVTPGPDLVICDEGHLLKNQNSALSKAVNRIRTARRIVLTGTPLQNNLKEYHCMVDFVKPKLLGTSREFQNRFANPISNGQCADSTDHDVRVMKRRAHVLHNLLEGCVQRYDYSVLTPFLPPKHEYVISIKLSDLQAKIYSYYLQNCARGGPNSGTGKGSGLFADFQVLARVWTHPLALKIAQEKADYRAAVSPSDSEGSINEFINDNTDDEDEDDVMCLDDDDDAPAKKVEQVDWKTRTRRSRGDAPPPEDELKTSKPIVDHSTWWSSMVMEEDFKNIELSGKLVVMMDVLRECELIGDKVLVFSQSIVSLDLIEEFLAAEGQKNEDARLEDNDGHILGTWRRDMDYFRFDGSTAAELRKTWVNAFNKESNHRARLFLISTRAGGLGINLTSANRVIIFDASWNPSHDVQSIFRIYRFGQKKPCYVYRFLAQGTMEEKIYNRQVIKQSLACRVVDEQQIERHFKASDLAELYQFDPKSAETRPIPNVPKDRLLAELTMRQKDWIVTFHEHDSLLQNKEGESLTEEERKAAWEDYENEKKGIMNTVQNSVGVGMVPNLQAHLVSIARTLTEQNPGISQEDLQIRLGRYVDQLKAMNVLPMMQPQFNPPPAASGVAASGAGPVTQDQAATAQMVAERQRAMYNLMMASQIANLGVSPANMGMPTQARRGRPPLPPSQSHFYPQLTTNYLMQNLAAQVANQQLPKGAIPNLNPQDAIQGSRPATQPTSSNASTAAQPKPGSSKEVN